MNNTHLLKLALKHADFNERNVHVSILTHKNKVISVGRNFYTKTSSAFGDLYKDTHFRIHSEADCIRKARYYKHLNKCAIWNFRFAKADDGLLLSMPCNSCMKLIQSFELRSVYFSTPYGISKLF
jgi:deoxycytidylate deaminase